MSTDSSIRAVLFDIDGTLVDSNYLHIDSWHQAFAEVGHPVDAWRIHRGMGMDSDRLVTELLGDHADQLGDAAKDKHSAAYKRVAHRLRPFLGARELIEKLLARDDIEVVLATSASSEELALLLDVLGLDSDRILTTNSDDVETAKPHPDIVRVALERAGVEAAHAVFIGDTVWDMQAARKAGTATIAVRSGGIDVGDLVDAGAGEVIRDVEELLDLHWLSR